MTAKELKAALKGNGMNGADFTEETKATFGSLYVNEYQPENRVLPPDPIEEELFGKHETKGC